MPMRQGSRNENGNCGTQSDGWLVAQFQRTKEIVYFEALHERYRRDLLVYCYGIFRSWDKAEDIVQEALTKAYVNLPKFAPGEFKPWLWTIGRNAAINEIKRRLVRREWERQLLAELVDSGVRPRIEERLIILEVLNQIPSILQRACLKLLYLEGCSYDEIAGLLEIDSEGVRSHITNGRKQFQKRWQAVLVKGE